VWTILVIPVFGTGEWLAVSVQSPMPPTACWPLDRIALVQSPATTIQIVAALVTGFAISCLAGPSSAPPGSLSPARRVSRD
jgi:hypothetical protein